MPLIPSEYDAFQALIEGLSKAKEAALHIAAHRPDQGPQWEKVAATLEITKELAYQITTPQALKGFPRQ